MGAVPAAGRAGATFVLQHALVDADRETARVVRTGPDLEFQIRAPRPVIGQWNEHAVGAFSTLGKIHACHLPTQLFPWRFSMPAERPGTQATRRAGIRVCNGDSEVGGPTVVIPAKAGIQGTPSLFRFIPYVRTENYIRDEPSSVSTPFDPSTSSGHRKLRAPQAQDAASSGRRRLRDRGEEICPLSLRERVGVRERSEATRPCNTGMQVSA